MKSMKATTDDGKDGKCSGVALSRFYFSGHESHHPMENHLHLKGRLQGFLDVVSVDQSDQTHVKDIFFPMNHSCFVVTSHFCVSIFLGFWHGQKGP